MIPLLFGIGVEDIPAPLQHQQAVNGMQWAQVTRLLVLLAELSLSAEPFPERGARQRVATFVRQVEDVLQTRMSERPVRFRLTPGTPVHFINSRHGLTLQPRDGQMANGTRLECGRFTGDLHHGWLVYPVHGGACRIVTVDGSKCVSVENDSSENGATLVLWSYEKHQSQHWRLISTPSVANVLSTLRVVNSLSGLCMMPNPDDRQVVQAPLDGFIDEDWWMVAAPAVTGA